MVLWKKPVERRKEQTFFVRGVYNSGKPSSPNGLIVDG